MEIKTFMQGVIEVLVTNAVDDFTIGAYSGRGMMGRTCLGITLDMPTVAAAMITAIAEIEDKADRIQTADIASGVMARVETDNLGSGVITYFPEIEWNEEFQN